MDFMYIGENTRFKDWPVDMEVPTSKVLISRGKEL